MIPSDKKSESCFMDEEDPLDEIVPIRNVDVYRTKRLEQALRDNLKRRKQQAKDRRLMSEMSLKENKIS